MTDWLTETKKSDHHVRHGISEAIMKGWTTDPMGDGRRNEIVAKHVGCLQSSLSL